MSASQNKQQADIALSIAPARLPQSPLLQGRYGSLVKMDAATHAPALWEAIKGHNDLWTYMRVGPFENEAAFLELQAERARASDPFTYAILDNNGTAVGLSSLMSIRPDMRVCEVGNILYTPALQRTQIGTEAQFLLMRYIFETLGYRRYEWKTNALNIASRRAALRYGFTFEGIFRQHEIVKGRNRDTAWFSMLDHEWPGIKTRFERWLSPGNFDASGRQKNPLNS